MPETITTLSDAELDAVGGGTGRHKANLFFFNAIGQSNINGQANTLVAQVQLVPVALGGSNGQNVSNAAGQSNSVG